MVVMFQTEMGCQKFLCGIYISGRVSDSDSQNHCYDIDEVATVSEPVRPLASAFFFAFNFKFQFSSLL